MLMRLNPCWFLAFVGIASLVLPSRVPAQTVITNTFAEVSRMASFWEVDPTQISSLANGQYSSIGGGTSTWQFIFPAGSTASDGDIHVNMGIAANGTGSTSGNNGESPIVPEVINATSAQLTTIDSLNATQAIVRGIFRWYSEHTGERKYEIHPATELLKWNGSAFMLTNDYRPNIKFDNGNTTQSTQHMVTTFDGSDVMTAAVMVADSTRIVFTYPSPRFNYCIYDGVTLSALTNDFVSQYFLLKPNLVPTAVIRCRIVTNTVAASVAAGLVSNQTVTVNALTRCDLLGVSNKIAGLAAGQTNIFTWPVEFITLNITNLGAVAGPVAIFSGNPTNGTEPLAVTFTDTSTGTITNRFWDFGDGSTTNVTTTTVLHTYAAGTNTVKLVVAGSAGVSTNTKPNYITVLTAFQAWQVQYFGSTTNAAGAANADPDGDGMSNMQEFLTGTDPTNGGSAFRITSVVRTGSDVLVTWTTGLGRTNALQSTTGTGGGSYNTNGFAAIFTVTNTTSTVTNRLDPNAATNFPSLFYRVRLVP